MLAELLGGLSKSWTNINEGNETWSAFDVVGHLIHGEETDWIQRMERILYAKHKEFEPFDRFAQMEKFKGVEMEFLLDKFRQLREQAVLLYRL